MAVLIIVLVAGSLGVASYAGGPPVTAMPGSTCGYVAFSSPGQVMLMEPGSFGVICILYGGNMDQPSPPINEPAIIYAIGPNGSYLGDADGTVTGINATFAAVVARGLANETVEYLVMVAPNAKDGAYVLWIGSSCPGFPLVIGDNISSVAPNLNHYYANPWSCPAANYRTLMIGFW